MSEVPLYPNSNHYPTPQPINPAPQTPTTCAQARNPCTPLQGYLAHKKLPLPL